MPSLGYLIDHPKAVIARTDPRNWDMKLLVPTALPVPDLFDLDLGPELDQDGRGACVYATATEIKMQQERADQGIYAFDTDCMFVGWEQFKHGYGQWPGDGIEEDGSYPLAVWQFAKLEGLLDRAGKHRKILAYYQLQGVPGSPEWIDTRIQTLLQYGAVSACSPWPNNWWSCPADGFLPPPAGNAGAHMFANKGFWLKGPVGPLSRGLSPTGRYWIYRQSWATYGKTDKYGHSGTFYIPFEADGDRNYYSSFQIAEIWKTIDVDEYPNPTPEPTDMTLPIYNAAPWDQAVDLAIGTQVYAPDGKTPLVKVGNALTAVRSPFAVSATMRLVRITTGGVLQAGIVATAACKNMRPYVTPVVVDTKHEVETRVDGVVKWKEMI